MTAGWRAGGALVCAAVLLASMAAGAGAAAGQLDRSFGEGGIGGGELGPHYAPTGFDAVAEEADGSVLAVRAGLQRRYLADGSPDPAFAPRTIDSPPPLEAVQADGKRLAPAEDFRGRLRRLNPDGTPDLSFNGGTSEPTASYWLRIIVPLPSGQILVAGTADQPVGKSGLEYRTGVSRLNADGTLDRSYGDQGFVYLLNDEIGYVTALVPQADGSALVISSRGAFRLTAAGKLDPGDRAAGAEKKAVGSFHALPGGGVALAGTVDGPAGEGSRDIFVARYRPNGELDPAFAAGRGIATADLGGVDTTASFLWGEDGSVLIGGATTRRDAACPASRDCVRTPVLVRFGAAGSLDPGFGERGLLRFAELAAPARSFTPNGVMAIASRRDGGLLVGGSAGPEASVAFLAAITAGGTLDPRFGSAGIVRETRPEPSDQTGGPLAVAPDGGLLVAGATTAGPGESAALYRFSPAGKNDSGYGEGGFARLWAIGAPRAIAAERSGAALVLDHNGRLTRVTVGGEVDSSFGGGGLVTLDRPTDRFNALAILPGGKILVAGATYPQRHHARMLVARLLSSGHPDRSFGRDGFATVGCRQRGRCVADRVAVQPDGAILLAGRVQRKRNRLGLARLRPDGIPDHGFGAAGLAALRVGYRSRATALAPAGERILLAGSVGSPGATDQALLLRYLPNGRLDRHFGRRGVARWAGAAPTAVLPTARRIVVVSGKSSRPALAFLRDGSPDATFARPRLGEKKKRGTDFVAALQGSKAVIAWTGVVGSASQRQIQLVRLRNR